MTSACCLLILATLQFLSPCSTTAAAVEGLVLSATPLISDSGFDQSQGECRFLQDLLPRAVNVSWGSNVSLSAVFSTCPYHTVLGVTVHRLFSNGTISHDTYNGGILAINGSNEMFVLLKEVKENVAVFLNVSYRHNSGHPHITLMTNHSFIRVQGALDQVTNISHHYTTPNTLHVCYRAPQSLIGVPYYFNISVYNTSTLVYSNITSQTCISITVHSPNLSELYIVEIFAVNEAGNGVPANITVAFPSKPTLLNVHFDLRGCGDQYVCPYLTAELPSNQLNCTPTDVTIVRTCAKEHITRSFHLTSHQFNSHWFQFGDINQRQQYSIRQHQFCSLQFIVSNIAGNYIYKNSNISTHSTQVVNIYPEQMNITCFECIAVVNSSALGCMFIFGHHLNDSMANLWLYYQEGMFNGTVCYTVYLPHGANHTSVLVYDINSLNNTADTPAYRNDTVYFPSAAAATDLPIHNSSSLSLIIGFTVAGVFVLVLIALTVIAIFTIAYCRHKQNQTTDAVPNESDRFRTPYVEADETVPKEGPDAEDQADGIQCPFMDSTAATNPGSAARSGGGSSVTVYEELQKLSYKRPRAPPQSMERVEYQHIDHIRVKQPAAHSNPAAIQGSVTMVTAQHVARGEEVPPPVPVKTGRGQPTHQSATRAGGGAGNTSPSDIHSSIPGHVEQEGDGKQKKMIGAAEDPGRASKRAREVEDREGDSSGLRYYDKQIVARPSAPPDVKNIVTSSRSGQERYAVDRPLLEHSSNNTSSMLPADDKHDEVELVYLAAEHEAAGQ